MEIWRKIQIANAICALVAVVLSVMACYFPNLVYVAMWTWSVTLWLFMFLGPMPVIERNKHHNQATMALSFFVAVAVAVGVDGWLERYPETDGFSRGMLVYSVAYTIIALLYAWWLKIKERNENK